MNRYAAVFNTLVISNVCCVSDTDVGKAILKLETKREKNIAPKKVNRHWQKKDSDKLESVRSSSARL